MHPSHLPLPCCPQSSAKDDLTRLTALTWLRVFVELYRGMLLLQYPSLLGVALANICHANTDIQQVRTPISCKGAALGVEVGKRFCFGWEESGGVKQPTTLTQTYDRWEDPKPVWVTALGVEGGRQSFCEEGCKHTATPTQICGT